jgi:hypothetical protein
MIISVIPGSFLSLFNRFGQTQSNRWTDASALRLFCDFGWDHAEKDTASAMPAVMQGLDQAPNIGKYR